MSGKWSAVRRIDDDAERVAKFVFTNPDAVAEAVLYRYPDYATRTVICCSTQSGCPIGCRFCGAGDHFVRSLTDDEICEQVQHCIAAAGVAPADMGRLQIMFMSMGEPMLNLKALIPALRALNIYYPNAELLVSTSGPIVEYGPFIEVSSVIPTVGLQFSVHETTEDRRNALIPFSKKLTLPEIGFLGRRWAVRTGRRPFFNYCAHDGNTSTADADRLAALFPAGLWCATVSVVCERSEGLPATSERQRALAREFASALVARGFDVRVFDPAGQDTVGGGCGQLWFVQQWMREHGARNSIGHDKPVVHAPSGECGGTGAAPVAAIWAGAGVPGYLREEDDQYEL